MNFSRYLIKKPIAAIQRESESGGLRRSLSALNLVSLGIGCIIGTGIFVLTGSAAAQYAGPAIVLSFVLAGLACAFAALCYAELSSAIPVSGSAYTYAYASLGEVFAWAMGWLLILEYGLASATVAVGWSGYVLSFLGKQLGIFLPPALTAAYGTELVQVPDMGWVRMTSELAKTLVAKGLDPTHLPVMATLFNLPAVLAIGVVSSLLVLGVKESANVNNAMVVVKVSVVVLFIAIGVFYIDPANWHPFIPPNSGVEGEYGWSGVLKGAGVIFFAYIGFEAVSTAAQEAKNPKRDIPIGILGSLIVCTILYMAVSAVLTGIVPYRILNVPEPIAVAADHIGLGWFAVLIKIGAIAGLSSVMLVLVYGQSRIFFAMSRDGLLPAMFSKVHPRFHTPHLNILVVGILVALAAGLIPLHTLGNLVNIGTLFAFTIICFSVLYMRVRQPEIERPFRVPFYPATPILGILFCGYLMWGLREVFFTLKLYFLTGLVLYFVYGQFRSKLAKGEPEVAPPLPGAPQKRLRAAIEASSPKGLE